jgi:hypothetical protein
MPDPIAPLDPYQPFVDENGRINQEWYSWISGLCARLATPGTTTFTGGTTAAVTFAGAGLPDQTDEDYMIHTEAPANVNLWVTAKTTSGFTINSSVATSDTVRWTLVKFQED